MPKLMRVSVVAADKVEALLSARRAGNALRNGAVSVVGGEAVRLDGRIFFHVHGEEERVRDLLRDASWTSDGGMRQLRECC